MALSGSVKTNSNGSSGYACYLRLDWTATQNQTANTSTISWKLYKCCVNGSKYSYSYGWTATIDGTVVSSYSGSSAFATNGSSLLLASGTKTVTHNNDGTKNLNIALSGAFYSASSKVSGSASTALNTIPRQSDISGLSGNTIGSKFSGTIKQNISGTTHDVYYAIGSSSWQSAGKGFGTSFKFTPPISMCSQIPNSGSGTMKVLLRTFKSGSQLGTDVVKSYTVNVPSSVIPTVSVGYTEATPDIASHFGCLVAGKSTLKISVSGSGVYGSTIKSYYSTLNGTGNSNSEWTTGILNEDSTITATVTDSRGRTSNKKTVNVPVVDYHVPHFELKSYDRCDASGNLNDDGNHLKIVYSIDISPIDNKNDKSIKFEYLNGETWTTFHTVSKYSATDEVYVSDEVFDTDKTYQIRVTVSDYFTTATSYVNIPTAFSLINYHKSGHGIAFGKVSETETFDVALPLGKSLLDQIYPVGTIYMSMNNTSPAKLFGGSWLSINGQTLIGTGPMGGNYHLGDDSTGNSMDSGWNYCCAENETFTVSKGSEWFRFGVPPDKWIMKNGYQLGLGTYTANATTFGSDPAQGVKKFVERLPWLEAGDKGGKAQHYLTKYQQPVIKGAIQMRPAHTWNTVDFYSGTAMSTDKLGEAWGSRLAVESNTDKTQNTRVMFDNGGLGAGHNNLPPYIAVNMWRRYR